MGRNRLDRKIRGKQEVNMERTFRTHEVRQQQELEGLWDFWTKEDRSDLQKMMVPGVWETCPGYENYRGTGFFETTFEGEGDYRLVFKGVSHTGTVFVDGERIGSHYNAYTPWDVTVRGLEPGRHTLRVEVCNAFHSESALHVPNDYYTYGGINRPVILEKIGSAFLRSVHVTTVKGESGWRAAARIRIESAVEGERVNLRAGICGEEAVTQLLELKKGLQEVELSLPCESPREYTPADPALQTVTAQLLTGERVLDDLTDRFGFREISVREGKVYFNGEEIRIRGFNRHEDHGLFGCAIPLQAMEYDLQLVKDLKGNAIRTCHYPNDERFLDLCDEQGILVWEESHARGLNEEQMAHNNFRSQSNDCIREMIGTHYNHPCIFTWGILNECASFSEFGREIYREQFELIKSLDVTRPTTFASCHFRTDICLDLPDIVSMNIYPLWYFDTPAADHLKEVKEWIATTEGRGKPLIISEIGAGAIPGWHAPGDPKWSEERQAAILREQLRAVLEDSAVTGVFIWQFADGRVGDENFYGRPRCMNNKGIVDELRRRKLSYGTVKEIYGQWGAKA